MLKKFKQSVVVIALIATCFGIVSLSQTSYADIMPSGGGGYNPIHQQHYRPLPMPLPAPYPGPQECYLPDIHCDPYRRGGRNRGGGCGTQYNSCGGGYGGGGMYSQMQQFFQMMLQFMNPWGQGATIGSPNNWW